MNCVTPRFQRRAYGFDGLDIVPLQTGENVMQPDRPIPRVSITGERTDVRLVTE